MNYGSKDKETKVKIKINKYKLLSKIKYYITELSEEDKKEEEKKMKNKMKEDLWL